MRTIWSQAVLLGLVFLLQNREVFGGVEKTAELSTADAASAAPAIDRSDWHHEEPKYEGYWKKKVIWKPRWVKSWQEKKVYETVWKKIWGPVIVKEWVSVPKPPSGWN